jgi:mRNA interferase RelE/StbE
MLREDFPKIPHDSRHQIERAINERLTVAPLEFGKQLQYSLKSLRCLRVGDWRVAYKVEGNTVTIVRIQNRRDAYKGW